LQYVVKRGMFMTTFNSFQLGQSIVAVIACFEGGTEILRL